MYEFSNLYSKPYSIKTSKNETLYHYTSAFAFKEILKGGSFWVSQSYFLNDSSEIIYIQKIIDRVCEEICPEHNNKGFFITLPDIIRTSMLLMSEIYVLSLSENPDSLALWSNYSNNEGYNIGLNYRDLDIALSKYQDENQIITIHGRVEYDEDRQIEIIKNEIEPVYMLWLEDNQLNTWDLLLKRLYIYSIFFKDSAFRQEEEYRVAFLVNPRENGVVKTREAKGLVQFRVNQGVLIPYIDVKIKKFAGINAGKLPLEKITIGPKNNLDIALSGVVRYLEFLNYFSVPVKKSAIPLRY